jgi:hypothetical protein
MTWALATLLLVLSWMGVETQPVPVTLTFYSCINDVGAPYEGGYCCGTFSGVQVGPGQAACSWDMPLGTVFLDPTGIPRWCTDRGAFGDYGVPWVDVWFYRVSDGVRWQQQVGTWGTIWVVKGVR